MGVGEIPQGQRVYLDTNVFIYALEAYADFIKPLTALFARLDDGSLQAVTSELTLAEVLVKPLLDNNVELQAVYEAALHSSPALGVMPVSREVLVQAARLRASHTRLRLPDAIHAATARVYACSVFITNDKYLTDLPDITVLLLSDLG